MLKSIVLIEMASLRRRANGGLLMKETIKVTFQNDNSEIFEKIVKMKAKTSGLELNAENRPYIIEQVEKMIRGEETDF